MWSSVTWELFKTPVFFPSNERTLYLYENQGGQFLNGDLVLFSVRGMKLVGQVTNTYHVQLLKAFRSVRVPFIFRRNMLIIYVYKTVI